MGGLHLERECGRCALDPLPSAQAPYFRTQSVRCLMGVAWLLQSKNKSGALYLPR
jgi:hypothetical protein